MSSITYEKAFKVKSTAKNLNYYIPALINFTNLALKTGKYNEAILYLELYMKNTTNPD